MKEMSCYYYEDAWTPSEEETTSVLQYMFNKFLVIINPNSVQTEVRVYS